MKATEPDYLELWRNLVLMGGFRFATMFNQKEKAEAYELATRRKNQDRRDILLDFVINDLRPEYAILDIGAGTGRWTVPLAKIASRVTAVEPAGPMLDILKRNAQEAGVTDRINLVPATWEGADIGMYDVSVSLHAMYLSTDFAAFIHKMEAHTKHRCYLGVRHFPIDGRIQELSTKIYGTRHDSPNFIIAFNALYQMGINANVLIEDLKHHWNDANLEAAFTRAKRHLRLDTVGTYDDLVFTTLKRRLGYKDGAYIWPDFTSTALAWWDSRAHCAAII